MMWPVMAAAKLFACRPSALLAIEDPVLALAVDLAAAQRMMRAEKDEEPVERVCL